MFWQRATTVFQTYLNVVTLVLGKETRVEWVEEAVRVK